MTLLLIAGFCSILLLAAFTIKLSFFKKTDLLLYYSLLFFSALFGFFLFFFTSLFLVHFFAIMSFQQWYQASIWWRQTYSVCHCSLIFFSHYSVFLSPFLIPFGWFLSFSRFCRLLPFLVLYFLFVLALSFAFFLLVLVLPFFTLCRQHFLLPYRNLMITNCHSNAVWKAWVFLEILF